MHDTVCVFLMLINMWGDKTSRALLKCLITFSITANLIKFYSKTALKSLCFGKNRDNLQIIRWFYNSIKDSRSSNKTCIALNVCDVRKKQGYRIFNDVQDEKYIREYAFSNKQDDFKSGRILCWIDFVFL